MDIDLREIQALHARYAREPVVIDLEHQIRAIPVPLMLSHQTAGRVSLQRRAWNARWKIGRITLMVIGGTVVCGAFGMGAARLWPLIHSTERAHPAASAARPASVQSGGPAAPSAPPVPAQPLTSQSLDSATRGTPGLAAVDPSALLHGHVSTSVAEPVITPIPTVPEEQKAIAPPIRQRTTISASAPGVATGAAQAAPATAASAASATAGSVSRPGRPVRHLARLHPSAPKDVSPATADGQKAAPAPAPRSSDVQLF
ncbi:hypothetical protein PXJ20_26490 [Paraburkholderia sp. A1RI_3L]|uniref:hypothetical protein n=1 Tax=Paraburkholderia TaxID=1822464 RepID=UPI003B800B8A